MTLNKSQSGTFKRSINNNSIYHDSTTGTNSSKRRMVLGGPVRPHSDVETFGFDGAGNCYSEIDLFKMSEEEIKSTVKYSVEAINRKKAIKGFNAWVKSGKPTAPSNAPIM